MGMIRRLKGLFSAVWPSFEGEGEGFVKKGKPELLDVTDGYQLAQEAQRWGDISVRGAPEGFKEVRRRFSTYRKVKQNIGGIYDLSEIVDEVTEKIYTDSTEDSRLKRIFG